MLTTACLLIVLWVLCTLQKTPVTNRRVLAVIVHLQNAVLVSVIPSFLDKFFAHFIEAPKVAGLQMLLKKCRQAVEIGVVIFSEQGSGPTSSLICYCFVPVIVRHYMAMRRIIFNIAFKKYHLLMFRYSACCQ